MQVNVTRLEMARQSVFVPVASVKGAIRNHVFVHLYTLFDTENYGGVLLSDGVEAMKAVAAY